MQVFIVFVPTPSRRWQDYGEILVARPYHSLKQPPCTILNGTLGHNHNLSIFYDYCVGCIICTLTDTRWRYLLSCKEQFYHEK